MMPKHYGFTSVEVVHEDALEGAIAFQHSWTENKPQPVDLSWLTPIIDAIPDKHAPLRDFERKCIEKWVGPQGYSVRYSKLAPIVDQYYDRSGTYAKWYRLPYKAIRILHHLQPLSWGAVWDSFHLKHKSNGGLSGWKDRREPGFAQEAFTEAVLSPYDYDPQVLGQKNERNKPRTIFMDSFANQFRSMYVWKPFQTSMNETGLCFWTSIKDHDAVVLPWLRKHPNYLVVEGDAESMDTWIDLFKVNCINHHISRMHRSSYARAFDYGMSLWETPLLTPCGWRRGAHSLFSGLYPTHYVECFWMIATMYDFIDTLDWKALPVEGDSYVFYVCGDDVVLYLDMNHLRSLPSRADVAAHWEGWGMMAREDKQRVAPREGAFFCKRYFSHRLSQSVAPVVLAVNNFVHPKSGSPISESGYDVVRFCQLFDNVGIAHPSYLPVVRSMVDRYPFLRRITPSELDVQTFNSKIDSFRVKILGQSFIPAASPTLKVLALLK